MATEVIVPIKIDPGDTPQSISDLRGRINSLRDSLVATRGDTIKYNSTLYELANTQRELNEINEDIRRTQSALNPVIENNTRGISDIRREIAQLTDSLVGADEASEEYRQALAGIVERKEELQRITEAVRNAQQSENEVVSEAPNGIKALRNEINTLRDQLANTERGSEEYRQTLLRLGDVQSQLNNINQDARISALNLSQQLSASVDIARQFAGAFTTANGIIALFGTESEALNSTLVRLQAGIQLVVGLQGLAGLQQTIPIVNAAIRGTVVQLGSLRAALIATGVGAIAVGLGVIIANIDTIREKLGQTTGDIERLTSRIEQLNIEQQIINNDVQTAITIGQIYGEEAITSINRQILAYQNEIDKIRELNDELEETRTKPGKIEQAFRKVLGSGVSGGAGIFGGYIRDFIFGSDNNEEIDNLIEENNKRIDKVVSDIENQYNAIEIAGARADVASTLRAQQEADERLRILAQEARDADRIRINEIAQIDSINDRLIEAGRTSSENRISQLTDQYEREFELFQKYGRDTEELSRVYIANTREILRQETEVLNREFFERLLSDSERNINDLQNQLNQAISEGENLNLIDELRKRIEEARIEQIDANIEFVREYNERLEELLLDETLLAEQRTAIEREIQDNINELQDQGLRRRTELINQEIAARKRQQQEEQRILQLRQRQEESYLSSYSSLASSASAIIGQQTAAGKAVAVAGATIDTYAAANKALRATAGLGPWAGIAAAAATVAAGIANVKNILSTNVSDVASSAVSSPSIQDNIVEPPSIDEVINEPIDRTDYEIDSNQYQEINRRVYVLESDIYDAMKSVRVSESEATF